MTAAAARKSRSSRSRPRAERPNGTFDAIEEGQTKALEAVREFTAKVDDALPGHGEEHSRAEEIVDAALAMSEKLVHAQFKFLRELTKVPRTPRS